MWSRDGRHYGVNAFRRHPWTLPPLPLYPTPVRALGGLLANHITISHSSNNWPCLVFDLELASTFGSPLQPTTTGHLPSTQGYSATVSTKAQRHTSITNRIFPEHVDTIASPQPSWRVAKPKVDQLRYQHLLTCYRYLRVRPHLTSAYLLQQDISNRMGILGSRGQIPRTRDSHARQGSGRVRPAQVRCPRAHSNFSRSQKLIICVDTSTNSCTRRLLASRSSTARSSSSAPDS
jgi:hypothetical protein